MIPFVDIDVAVRAAGTGEQRVQPVADERDVGDAAPEAARRARLVDVKAFTDSTLYTKTATPGEPFDMVYLGWLQDYQDPSAFLNVLLEDGSIIPTLNHPTYRARLAGAARLTGAKRFLTYARLDADLARNATPLIAFGNASSHDLFSARIGCQTYGVYGIDLAALCIKHRR
jgi:hypothetical protein